MYTYIYTYMTKVISISDDAYTSLADLKGPGDSFTDVVKTLTEKASKKPISSFSGSWEGDKKKVEKIFKDISKERREAKLREVKL